ncbi:MAG: Hsp33 family molecular chaperone HslO [Proteobacteria bacterium]|jgi:molecular chaperone Hsp33|nr:Hsp33 family molecular chaperone HslO [Pseudomonadota bacterium]
MLTDSRLYSFLDSAQGIAIHFFDGQKLVHDLAITHNLRGDGFAFFRDSVLGAIPLISFLKSGESLGLYLDSSEPFFRLKIETNFAGFVRTLLIPEEFETFPDKITGITRVTKLFPHGKTPYTSVVSFHEEQSNNVFNKLIEESYQANAKAIVSPHSDQSLLIHKLPKLNVNSELKDGTLSLERYIATHEDFFDKIFQQNLSSVEHVVKPFEKKGFAYLSSRHVEFYCPCSLERMQDNLRMLFAQDPEALFAGKQTLEAKCDYCKKTYEINRDDLKAPFTKDPIN